MFFGVATSTICGFENLRKILPIIYGFSVGAKSVWQESNEVLRKEIVFTMTD